MSGALVVLGPALWLGVLTSISPCPLASNIAAVSFVGRQVGSPARVLLAGLFYSLGRAFTYVIVGMLVASSILSIPRVSFFLQEKMNLILGPLLIVIGIGILIFSRMRGISWAWGQGIQERFGRGGLAGAGALGILFALSFCPVSAGLFFGALLPLAVNANSRVIVPAAYGIGTGLPVMAFAVLIVVGVRWVGRAFHAATRIERIARPVTAGIFIMAGLYLSLRHIAGLSI